jgi:hypothetical protein
MYLIVKNKSDHIIKLEKSILQFENSSGSEYPIGLSGGWIESTSMFIDGICRQHETRVDDILIEYNSQNMSLITKITQEINALKDANNRKLNEYVNFIRSIYEPEFKEYQYDVERYNKLNLAVKETTGLYLQEPIRIDIDHSSAPASLIQNKQYECSQANLALDQSSREIKSKIDRNIQEAKIQMIAAISKKCTEWRSLVKSVQTNATKVVRSDGVFDPIVIPPGKHRTILIPGINIPSEMDKAGNVTKRVNLSFELKKEDIDVFFSAD